MPHTKNPLAMISLSPSGVTFSGEEKGEEIILMLRAHIVTLVPPAALVVFLIFAPTVLGVLMQILGINLFASLGSVQTLLLGVLWYFFVFGYAFYKFIFWYFNIYVLTNERVVDFDFKGVLHIETSYANLNQIQDVTPKRIGFFSTFFSFGSVFIQTAAEKSEFDFIHVPQPNMVARAILNEIRKEQGEKPGETK